MIKINATGCGVMDILVTDMDYTSRQFKKVRSRKKGDGGLVPGELVFGEELERFTKKDFDSILREFRQQSRSVKENLGGPAAVSLVHLGQVLPKITERTFYQNRGNDAAGNFLAGLLKKSGVCLDYYKKTKKPSPRTLVLSDPQWDGGQGDRCFATSLGAMQDFTIKDLDESFYKADICIYAATALSPKLHKDLPLVLKKARSNKALNLVFTVYDFFSEKNKPGKPWELGKDNKAYAFTDLLAVDLLEAEKMSGCDNVYEAMEFFQNQGCRNVIITDGPRPITFQLTKGLFNKDYSGRLMVPGKCDTSGDTTGCGDNFAAGIIASLARQMEKQKRRDKFDGESMLVEALCTGSLACSYAGGVFHESRPGEKTEKLLKMIREYKQTL